MTGSVRDAFEVIVPADALSALIIAVHEAGTLRAASRRKWRYGNVIRIYGAHVADLAVNTAMHRHRRERMPVAALAVTQRRLTVDVLFEVTDASARAWFSGAGLASIRHDPGEETAWASFLATGTVDALARAGIRTDLQHCLEPL